MERRVKFHTNQQGLAEDHNQAQEYVQRSLDNIIFDAITSGSAFSGFDTTSANALSVSVATGRLYREGRVYTTEAETTVDLMALLPLVSKKIVAIVVGGTIAETLETPVKFLTDSTTRATQVQTVARQIHRSAVVQTVSGVESATPQKPTVSSDLLTLAWVTLSTAGVDSIEMNTDGRIDSVIGNALRLDTLESWRVSIGQRIDTLASDMAALAFRVQQRSGREIVDALAADVVILKEALELEDGYSGYGADRYLDSRESDTDDPDYLAKIEEGVRFPDVAADENAMALFQGVNPQLNVHADGLVLPAYEEIVRLSIDHQTDQMAVNQYASQTINSSTLTRSRRRQRYGEPLIVCANNQFWHSGKLDWQKGIFERNGETFEVLGEMTKGSYYLGNGYRAGGYNAPPHGILRLRRYWEDRVETAYWDRLSEVSSDVGSMVANTFLVSQDAWITSLNIGITQVAVAGDVTVLLCDTVYGKPDTSKVYARTTVAQADLQTWPNWTNFPIEPTFVQNGRRYALVLITQGAHYIATSNGAEYSMGTLFYSTDGDFFSGDLSKDICFQVKTARFQSTRTEVELDALSLSGGIVGIDIQEDIVVPAGTELFYEVQESGQSTWHTVDAVTSGHSPLANLPPLLRMRAVMIHTQDVAPGIDLANSLVGVNRPGVGFVHISENLMLPAASQSIKVIVDIGAFNPANHTLSCTLDDVTNNVIGIAPSATTDEEIGDGDDDNHKRIRRTYVWTASEITTATSEFKIRFTGATTSALDLFLLEQRIHLSF